MRFIFFLLPIFLVFVGIRLPDFSRPHKPKPVRRAILDKAPASTVLKSAAKAVTDPCIPHQTEFVVPISEEFTPETQSRYGAVSQLLLSQLPPRAPPAELLFT